MFSGLFPLDGPGGLRGQVVKDAVHARDLMGDAVGDMLQKGKGHLLDGGRHGIAGVDRTNHDRPVIAALPVTDAGRPEVGHDGEVLPDLSGQTVLCKFLAQDGVGLSDGLKPVPRDGPDTAYAKARAREGLTVDHPVRQAKFAADDADLVLEEDADRLDQFKVQIIRQSAGIVVRLDAAFALENIRPDRSPVPAG